MILNLLSKHYSFNNYNRAESKTYDDIFQKRLFSAYIVQEGNLYNNRSIIEYKRGESVLLEGRQINERIRNYELDQWEN